MSIVECKNCGKKISDKAPYCPYCRNERSQSSIHIDLRTSTKNISEALDLQHIVRSGKLNTIQLVIIGGVLSLLVVLGGMFAAPLFITSPRDSLNIPYPGPAREGKTGVRASWVQLYLSQRQGRIEEHGKRSGLEFRQGKDGSGAITIETLGINDNLDQVIAYGKLKGGLFETAGATRIRSFARQLGEACSQWANEKLTVIEAAKQLDHSFDFQSDGRRFKMSYDSKSGVVTLQIEGIPVEPTPIPAEAGGSSPATSPGSPAPPTEANPAPAPATGGQ